MAITNASRVADFGSGIGTEGAVLQVDNTNERIGIGTNNPQAMLQVGTAVTVYGNSGIVSATSYYGSGANLTGISVDSTALKDSNDVVRVQANTSGAVVTGIVTATTFIGALTGDASGSSGSCTGNAATATLATNASGLSGTPNITINNLVGVAATFSGAVTYEDVTNIDSVGIVTARGGFEIGASGVGGTITSAGVATFAGSIAGSILESDAQVYANVAGTRSGTDSIFFGYDENAAQVFKVDADGAATFSGYINTTAQVYTGDAYAGNEGCYLASDGLVMGEQSVEGNDVFRGKYNGTTTSTIKGSGAATFRSTKITGGNSNSIVFTGTSDYAGNTTTSTITNAGVATFASTVQSGGDPWSGANNGSKLYPDGALALSNSTGSTALVNLFNSNSTPTVTITAAGAATFATDVTVTSGHFSATGSSTSTKTFISNYDGNENAIIKADGSATFDGSVTSSDGVSGGGNASAGWSLNPGTTCAEIGVQGKSLANGGAATNAIFRGFYGSSNTIRFNCDGSATFAGNVVTGDADYTSTGVAGVEIFAGGYINAQRIDTGSSDAHALYQGYHGNVQTFSVTASGAATFAGNTTIGNYSSTNNATNGLQLQSGGAVLAQKQNNTDVLWYGMKAGTTNSSITAAGTITGTSKSFTIPHPLSSKTETHNLVHGSIEGPQADLIYRGQVTLEAGEAVINIDTVSRMTEGTFQVLCKNVNTFTSNESDWTAVRGSVVGNILTIEAQDNTSTAQVSWMVVGERKDSTFINGDTTDANGRLIVEPAKP